MLSAAKEEIVPLLAARLLCRNSHPDHQLPTVLLYPGIGFTNSNTATGLAASFYDESRRSRSTGQYRDGETGVDYFNARYFTGAQGRFNSPDPLNAGADLTDPQTWNGYAYVRNSPLSAVDPTGMVCSGLYGLGDTPCNSGNFGGGGGSGSFANNDPFQLAQIPVTVTSYFPGIAPQPTYLTFPSGTTSATITFGTPPGSWQTVQVGTVGDYDVPVGIDIWQGQQQLWHNTAVVGNAAAVATGAILAAPIVADAASSLTLARVAVGTGQPYGIHFAIGVGGTWLHWIKDAVDEFGNIGPAITTEAAEAWAMRAAWFRVPVPVLNPTGVLGSIGKPASNCFTAACYAVGQGWIP